MTIMFIDTKLLNDTRVVRLGMLFGLSRDETLGRLLDVWAICYQRQAMVLSIEDIDIAARQEGFAAALVKVAELGDATAEGVYLRGSFRVHDPDPDDHEKEQILERARAHAHARAHPRARAQARARAHPSVSENGVVSSVEEEDLEPSTPTEGKQRAITKSELRPVTDAFQSRFLAAYHKKPTWGSREISQLKTLIRKHDADEVVRRIAVMFDSPPLWLQPPYVLDTLVRHFDKLVVPSRANDQRSVNGLRFGRVEPKPLEEMDPRPPWEIDDDR